MAFNYFADEQVDIAIIEVGLGGRLDSTNVVTPLLSLITNISYDHTYLLGNTLQKIAAEKAGIIKPGIPVVISQTQSEVKKVFIGKAKKENATIYFADDIFQHQKESYYPKKGLSKHIYKFKDEDEKLTLLSGLPGTYQKYNIAGVLTAIRLLQTEFYVTEKQLLKGLKKAAKLTGLHGRWEILQKKNPRVICDTGHNEEGIKEVIECVEREFTPGMAKGRLHVVFGAVNDKDLSAIFTLLKKNKHFATARYYFCKPNIPRGMEVKELNKAALKQGLKGTAYPTVKQAYEKAKQKAKPKDLVFVGGSTFTVAEVV